MKKLLSSSGSYHLALLILRVLAGIMMIMHGLPKIVGGPDKWEKVGSAVSNFGIDFAPVVFGLVAAIIELVGGALIAIGLLTRPVAILLVGVMLVAASSYDGGLLARSHPIETGLIFLFLAIAGAGKYSFDKKFFG